MDLQFKLQLTQARMQSLYTVPVVDKRLHAQQIAILTRHFNALLSQKARQEVLNHVGNDNRSHTQNTRTGKTDNT